VTAVSLAPANMKEMSMDEPRDPPKAPVARETKGEGAPKRKRNEGTVSAEEKAEPERGNERTDGRIIQRERDARNPEGI
jgi:hypothetical protein